MSEHISTDQFLDAAGYRRTVYKLNDQSPISDKRIEDITEKVLKVTPSVYNTQMTRITLVFGDAHKKQWALQEDVIKPVILGSAGEEAWKGFEGRLKMFGAAYGTALFWEDTKILGEEKAKHKNAASTFDQFSEHGNAMHQIHLWTSLELEGLGANLQHHQAIPGVEEMLRKENDLPEYYSLKAQLVFGGKAQPHPESKPKRPSSETLKVVQ